MLIILVVTNKLYLKEFEKQFGEKQIETDCSKTEVQHKWLSKFIIKSVDPANAKKVSTFSVFMPSLSNHSKQVFDSFSEFAKPIYQSFEHCKKFKS